jgi:hypothetical protein
LGGSTAAELLASAGSAFTSGMQLAATVGVGLVLGAAVLVAAFLGKLR